MKLKKNVMYTAHFYAATHKKWNRDKIIKAIKAGTPVFISEFSITEASGNGKINYSEAKKWKALIKKYKLSRVGWSLSNKSEESATIKKSCKKTSGWSTKDLTAWGKWLRTYYRDSK